MKKWTIKKTMCLGTLLVSCLALNGCAAGKTKEHSFAEEQVAQTPYSQDLFAMDTYMSLTAYGSCGQEAVEAAIKEIQRLDGMWSVSSQTGEIYQINQQEQGDISEDTAKILEYAQRLYTETDGAFDISVYPLMELWGFTSQNYKVPSQEELEAILPKVNQSKIQIDFDGNKVTLAKGQKIDLGAIAKGYTSNRIMEIYKEHGVTSGMVSLGGNVQTLGEKPDGSLWGIGIQDPDSQEGDIIGALQLKDQAVITSGGYERYFEEDGVTYHHILDTRTGFPVDKGLVSVSIVSGDGTLADGLSTSLFAMGQEKALKYWRSHSDEFDAILVNKDRKILVTQGIKDGFSTELDYEIVEK